MINIDLYGIVDITTKHQQDSEDKDINNEKEEKPMNSTTKFYPARVDLASDYDMTTKRNVKFSHNVNKFSETFFCIHIRSRCHTTIFSSFNFNLFLSSQKYSEYFYALHSQLFDTSIITGIYISFSLGIKALCIMNHMD